MTPLIKQLSNYAAYHRDPRNIHTHFVGIPLIVLAVFVLLSRPSVSLMGLMISPALVLYLASSLYYLSLSFAYGLLMMLVHGMLLTLADNMAMWSTVGWLTGGVGLFVVGWAIQFWGHHYEGRKPAFFDDLRGLIVGPLFVVAELGFALRLGRKIQHDIEAVAGPVQRRR